MLAIHILAGALGLLSGYLALYATKGATLHRRSGMVFACVMITMSITGMLIAATEGVAPAVNIPAALTTLYLVVTGLTTVRRPADGLPRLDAAAMWLAFAIGLACVAIGFEAAARGGARAGLAYPAFLFAGITLTGGLGDRRMMRAGGVSGPSRLARHLWRMCMALFIAALSFFVGQADEFPPALRIVPVLAPPVLVVPVTMIYWLRRLRTRDRRRGQTAAQAAARMAANGAAPHAL